MIWSCSIYLILALSIFLFAASKCYFLAPRRAGWLLLLSNIVYETLEIKLHLRRPVFDGMLFGLAACSAAYLNVWAALLICLALAVTWIKALLVERRWLADIPAHQQHTRSGRVPLPVPELIAVIRGPVVERTRSEYHLGAWLTGQQKEFTVLILNPGIVRPQLPLEVTISTESPCLKVIGQTELSHAAPEPGTHVELSLKIHAVSRGAACPVSVTVRHGDWQWSRVLIVSNIADAGARKVARVGVRRWKYGAQAGFVWRGDNDMYDPSTFQSAEGLRMALGLAGRFMMPTTVMLSTRLSLVQKEHENFCAHYGWNRHSMEIPDFIEFLKDEVDKTADAEFPQQRSHPYAAEIGNHGHLHYGTHAAACEENNWKSHAGMGEGPYSWMKQGEEDSFSEQRENIRMCSKLIRDKLGVETSCFTIPSDVYDKHTSRAAEAAGIEVATETDMSKFKKLLFFPVEHHPEGCHNLAELTRVLPRDPVNAAQVAMLKFWIGFARRHRRAMVYLAHHHLVMYAGNRCYNLTAELLRYVLAGTEGDVYAATLTGLGRYWRDVLSQKTRKIELERTEVEVIVRNTGERELSGIPLEVDYECGMITLHIVTVSAGSEVRVKV